MGHVSGESIESTGVAAKADFYLFRTCRACRGDQRKPDQRHLGYVQKWRRGQGMLSMSLTMSFEVNRLLT